MANEKIAILVDSCCNVPKSYVKKYGMYEIPLKIIYKDREYLDGVNITSQEIYEHLDVEIPKTSLPAGEQITEIMEQIRKDGFTKVIAVTISSGLSGTNNMVNLIAKDMEGMDIFVLDTKNISIGSGFHAIQAGRYIEQGASFEEIQKRLLEDVKNCKVFFVVETLEYLQKGGRIGKVASLFGNALNLKPIISCGEDGIYYTVAKVRGRKQSLSKTRELALAYLGEHKHYNLSIINGDAREIADAMRASIEEKVQGAQEFVDDACTPALGVHTGPGTIGICVQLLQEE